MSVYWSRRAAQRQKQLDVVSKATLHRIGVAYDRAIKQAFSESIRIVNNYAKAFDLTAEEAKKLLHRPASAKELEYLRQKISSVHNPDVKKRLQAQLSAEAYSARLNKLGALRITARVHMAKAGEAEERLDYAALKQAYQMGLIDTKDWLALYLGHKPFIENMPDSRMREVIYNRWSGRNFSQRLWANNRTLSGQIEKGLTELFLSGKVTRRSYLDLIKSAEGSKLAANRLLRTETAYVTSMSTIDAYKHAGIVKYRFSAVNDMRTSEICEGHDGKIYTVDEAKPGVNLPPLHPFCRSSIEPVFAVEAVESPSRTSNPGAVSTHHGDRMTEMSMNSVQLTGQIRATANYLAEKDVTYIPGKRYASQPTHDDIVERIGGPDRTKGSCASMAFCYAGNVGGWDIRDFRGGESTKAFANYHFHEALARLPEISGRIETETFLNVFSNELKATDRLLKSMTAGKEYVLIAGLHASVVRKHGDSFQYLELQNVRELNGWQPLGQPELQQRFGCSSMASYMDEKNKVAPRPSILMEVDKLKDCNVLVSMLGYINTVENRQKKGSGGGVK